MTAASPCPFCAPDEQHVFHRDALVLGLWDRYPVSRGHALLVTARHVGSWFEATWDEQRALIAGVERARILIEEVHQPDGYNIGINVGTVAGQTVPHLHLHLIPRYAGDTPDPLGGVRHVLPNAATYPFPEVAPEATAPPHSFPLVEGGQDPLLPHLVALLPQASAVDINVAFVMRSGVDVLVPHLHDMLAQGGRLRLLTGDYLGATDPVALRRLLDLQSAFGPDRVLLRVFEAGQTSFHPKAYVIRDRQGATTAFVGSSNLSGSALGHGVEWNYRIITRTDAEGITAVARAFDRLFEDPHTRELTDQWVAAYSLRRTDVPLPPETGAEKEPLEIPQPHRIQAEALAALQATRTTGAKAGLVVLATGLGKTWLSAFDTSRPEYARVLFVAHREEILGQAMATFRRVRPNATLGLYTGTERTPDADVLFASIQTLGRVAHLSRFARDRFDYIVVDEFHHAAAATYRRVIDHFAPNFLLGLTATPERTDGGDLLALCGENLVYRCDLIEGIRAGLLAPFDYFGVPDDVDYDNIPWRSNRFDETELTNAVATERRATNALEQLKRRGGRRTLAFCVSQRHADFMAAFFEQNGLRAAAVHAGPTSAPRALSLERLNGGELDVLCAVDMFNEGVDLPRVDTIMMLRPTESRIVWLQQFGRGLRFLLDKRLKVVDYIGNHRSFLLKPRTLLGLPAGDGEIRAALQMLEQKTFELPPGCSVTYDLEAKQIIEALLRGRPGEALKAYYADFLDREGVRPTAAEAYHDGYDPAQAKRSHGSWFGFVRTMGGLENEANEVFESHREFLDALEVTEMVKSYKMLVLGALLAEGLLFDGTELSALATAVRRFADRYPALHTELLDAAADDTTLQALLVRNPIAAWVGGRGTGGHSFFAYDTRRFTLAMPVAEPSKDILLGFVREIVDWRLASYVRRVTAGTTASRFEGQVEHVGGQPIVRLPSRLTTPGMPDGVTEVLAGDASYRARFLRDSVHYLSTPDSDENVLPVLLREWFGPEAGLPGRHDRVLFERRQAAYEVRPLKTGEAALNVGQTYDRDQIPPLFGKSSSGAPLQTGVIHFGDVKRLLLLVTLDKEGMQKEHKYADRFESRGEFRWQSQNRTAPAGSIGQIITGHDRLGYQVHLFVRRTRSHDGKAAPFVYCGELIFRHTEGTQPMNVTWQLRTPLSNEVARKLGVR